MNALAVKILLGVAGVAAIPVAWQLVYHYKDANSFGKGDSKLDRATLSSTKEYQIGGKKNTFGGRFSSYFLDTAAELNKKMWDEKWNSIKNSSNEPDNNGFFKDIKSGNKNVDELKKVCSSKYEASLPTNEDDKKKWDEVWKYCAIPELAQRPKTVNESSEYSDNDNQKIGQELRNELISANNSQNEKFWGIRRGEFWAQKEVLNWDSKYNAEKEKYRFFYDDSRKDKEIKEICKEAYDKPTSTTNSSKDNPTKEEVKKFCSMEMIRFFDKNN